MTDPTAPDLSLDERFAILTLMVATRADRFEHSNADLAAETGVTIGPSERENLVSHGFIDARQDGRTWMHELTDRGWRRAEDELSAGPPEGASDETRLLYGLMGRFASWMARSDLHVADVFTLDPTDPTDPGAGIDDSTPTPPAPELRPADAPSIEDQVRSVYTTLAREPGAWVGLRHIRDALPDVPRADLDTTLLDMVLEPGVMMDPEFNQKTLTPTDRAAELHMGGENMHLLSIQRTNLDPDLRALQARREAGNPTPVSGALAAAPSASTPSPAPSGHAVRPEPSAEADR